MSDALSIECRDGIAWLAVNRPEVRNALDSALCAELAGAFADLVVFYLELPTAEKQRLLETLE